MKTKMQAFGNYDLLLLLLLFLYLGVFVYQNEAISLYYTTASEERVSAIFIFGDSTSDPGNNNFILTPFKGNFPPYGQDFANHVPTGRFTNGRLSNDFIGNIYLRLIKKKNGGTYACIYIYIYLI